MVIRFRTDSYYIGEGYVYRDTRPCVPGLLQKLTPNRHPHTLVESRPTNYLLLSTIGREWNQTVSVTLQIA